MRSKLANNWIKICFMPYSITLSIKKKQIPPRKKKNLRRSKIRGGGSRVGMMIQWFLFCFECFPNRHWHRGRGGVGGALDTTPKGLATSVVKEVKGIGIKYKKKSCHLDFLYSINLIKNSLGLTPCHCGSKQSKLMFESSQTKCLLMQRSVRGCGDLCGDMQHVTGERQHETWHLTPKKPHAWLVTYHMNICIFFFEEKKFGQN